MPLHDVGGGHLERLRVTVASGDIAGQGLDLFLRAGERKPDLLLRQATLR